MHGEDENENEPKGERAPVYSREIEAMLARARKVGEGRFVELDQPLEAGNGGALAEYLNQGWSVSEPWGRWSDGETASLNVLLRVPTRRDLIAEFAVQAYVSEKTPEQRVTVFVNGEEADSWSFTSKDPTTRTLEIAAKGLRFGMTAAALDFRFAIASPESPQATGESDDARRLGFGLRSIRFSLAPG
ncbi:MAG: hypothetical protein JO038_03730 [Alphaproteobacteria bacterium]|nr:hypothetical protein [Alphaproteobacteria bacterium]